MLGEPRIRSGSKRWNNPERPADDIHADQARSMTARLEDGFALASFASQLAGGARR